MNIEWEKYLDKAVAKLELWVEEAVLVLPNIVTGLLVFVVFFMFARVLKNLIARALSRFSSYTQLNLLISGVVSFVVIGLGLIIALEIMQLGKAVLSLLAGVGVVGLALGFAFQDIAANFMSGMLILMRRPFRVGEIVESNDFFGTIEGISLRNTRLKTWTGQLVLIPNKEVYQNPLTNYSQTRERRVDLPVGVSYGDDLEKVERVTLEAVRSIDERDKSRDVELFYEGFGDSSINFMLRFWAPSVEQKSYLGAKHAAVKAIKRAFDENDVTIPFPIRTLDFGIKGGQTLAEVLKGHNLGGRGSQTGHEKSR